MPQPIGNYPPLVQLTSPRISAVDNSQMLALRRHQDAMQRQQDQIRRQQEDRAQQQLLGLLEADPNIDLRSVAPAIDGLTMKDFQFGEAIQQASQERLAREDELKNAVSTIQQAIPLGAGRLDEYGQVVQDPRAAAMSKAAEERALQTIERQRPEQVADAQALIGLQREAARQNLLGQSAGIQREYTKAEENAMLDDWGTRFAGQGMGVIPQANIEEEIREYAGPDRTPSLLRQAHNDGQAKLVRARLQLAGVRAGTRTPFDQEVESNMALYGDNRHQAVARAKKTGFDDPVTGQFIPKVSVQYEEKRWALSELISSVEPLRDAAIAAARAGAEEGALIGPVLGAPGIQEMSRFFALQHPAVANYELQYRNFTSRMLKAIQGSRPSDFDLRFYLGLMPMLTELTMTPDGELNPAALQRLSTMEQMLRRSGETILDKKLARKAYQLRSQEWTEEDYAAKALAEQYANGEIDIGKFTSGISDYRVSRGSQFVPNAVRTKPATSNPVDLYLSGP
jgi:hypothetical protein